MKTPIRTILLAGAALAALALAPLAAAEDGADLLGPYARVHAALAADSAAGVTSAAAELGDLAAAAAKAGPHAAAYAAVAEAARALTGADLAALREQSKPLSTAMAKLVEAGALAGADIYYCSMARGYWLQGENDSAVRNPYYGKSMLECGWKVEKVEG
jgi:hypothetical protein